MTTKVRTGRNRTMGHDWSRNVGLDKHAVCQRGVGRLILLGGQGIQDGGVNPQRTHRRSSRGGGGRRGGRGNTSSGVGILIALGGDASEKRATRSVVGVTISTRRAIASGRLSRWGGALGTGPSSASRDFGMDEATPFAVGARSGNPKSLRGGQKTTTN